MGSLPAILGLVVLFIVFSLAQRPVPHDLQHGQPGHPGRLDHRPGDGHRLRPAARRDRPVRRRRRRRLGDGHRADADRPRLALVGGAPSPASPSAPSSAWRSARWSSMLGIPSFVVTLAFFLALQAVPLKLIGSGGSLRFNDPVLRGLSIKNVPVTAGLDRRRRSSWSGFAALSLWRYRSLSPRAWCTSRSPWCCIQIAVLAVHRARPHRAAQREPRAQPQLLQHQRHPVGAARS